MIPTLPVDRSTSESDVRMERSVLAALVLEILEVVTATERLPQDPGVFTTPERQEIWARVKELYASGVRIGHSLVRETISPAGRNELAACFDHGAEDAEHALILVHEAWMRRQAKDALASATRLVETQARVPKAVLAETAGRLLKLCDTDGVGGGPMKLVDIHDEAWRELMAKRNGERLPGIPSGLDLVDSVTNGMSAPQFWVIAGPSSSGKSVMILDLVMQSARLGKGVLVFPLEMSRLDYYERIWARLARVAMTGIRRAVGDSLTEEQLERLRVAKADAERLPITIDDRTGSIDQLVARAKAFKAAHPLDVVAIDYLQRVDDIGFKGDAATRELEHKAKAMKTLAKQLGVVVVTGTQVNEKAQRGRKDRRTTRQDAKGAQAIFEEADVFLSVWRENYESDAAEIAVLKNRQGATTGYEPVKFDRGALRFRNA